MFCNTACYLEVLPTQVVSQNTLVNHMWYSSFLYLKYIFLLLRDWYSGNFSKNLPWTASWRRWYREGACDLEWQVKISVLTWFRHWNQDSAGDCEDRFFNWRSCFFPLGGRRNPSLLVRQIRRKSHWNWKDQGEAYRGSIRDQDMLGSCHNIFTRNTWIYRHFERNQLHLMINLL